MLKKFRYWLADVCLDMAIRLHFEMVLVFVMDARDLIDKAIKENRAAKRKAALDAPKRPRGRPKGSKDTQPRVAREGVKLGRPKGRKDSVGKLVNGGPNA